MMPFQKQLDHLASLLVQHPNVISYQALEKEVKSLPQLQEQTIKMKAYQQEAVLYQKLEKFQAYESSSEAAILLEAELNQNPLVQAYRVKLQDTSDLLQYVTKSIEDKINEELTS